MYNILQKLSRIPTDNFIKSLSAFAYYIISCRPDYVDQNMDDSMYIYYIIDHVTL